MVQLLIFMHDEKSVIMKDRVSSKSPKLDGRKTIRTAAFTFSQL